MFSRRRSTFKLWSWLMLVNLTKIWLQNTCAYEKLVIKNLNHRDSNSEHEVCKTRALYPMLPATILFTVLNCMILARDSWREQKKLYKTVNKGRSQDRGGVGRLWETWFKLIFENIVFNIGLLSLDWNIISEFWSFLVSFFYF